MHKKIKIKAKVEKTLALILIYFFNIQLKKNRGHLKTESGF